MPAKLPKIALAATFELVLELSKDRVHSRAVARELAEAEVAPLIAAWDREAHFSVDLAVMVEGGPRTRVRGAAAQDATVKGGPNRC